MSTREQIQEVFDGMQAETDWDLSGPMLWGYFFTHATANPLQLAAAALRKDGYTVVDSYLSDKESPKDPDVWFLHVEKVEVHSVDSLLARSEALDAFAAKHGLDAYDGWDVGPASEAS